jgi:hypothetical protein
MNVKNENPESPYIIDEAKSEPWIKSKAGKLTALIAGGVLALGASFGAGIAVGSQVNPVSRDGFGAEGFGGDADYKFPGGQMPNGQHPPRPGDQDDDNGQFKPGLAPSADPETQKG